MKLWITLLSLLFFTLPASAQRGGEICAAEGAVPAEISAILSDGTITLKEGVMLRLANIVWPDRIEPQVRDKLARGLEQTLLGQKVSWKPSAGPDRWGITPAFLFVQEPDSSLPPFWLQAGMIEAGLVPAWPENLQGACWTTLLEHESVAIQRRRGHWAPRVQAQRLARIAAEPKAHAGRRIVVQWRVASARKWRDLYFLNMGARRMDGAAISLAPQTISALTARGDAPEILAGRSIVARIIVPSEGLRRARLESADHLQVRR